MDQHDDEVLDDEYEIQTSELLGACANLVAALISATYDTFVLAMEGRMPIVFSVIVLAFSVVCFFLSLGRIVESYRLKWGIIFKCVHDLRQIAFCMTEVMGNSIVALDWVSLVLSILVVVKLTVSISFHCRPQPPWFVIPQSIPKEVVSQLNLGSPVSSMDFHPVQRTLLLAGTTEGDVCIWEVGNQEKIVEIKFEVWDLEACSMLLQASLGHECSASVNRVIWSPDGNLCGVAYSRHIIHLYTYSENDALRNHLEIDAHVGDVNDLTFCYGNNNLCVITCGGDKAIKVWDAATGASLYTFDGLEEQVNSICPSHQENIKCIYSIGLDGIKTWQCDNMGSRMHYNARGFTYTTMAYSADGTRLFVCGINREGRAVIMERNETDWARQMTLLVWGKV